MEEVIKEMSVKTKAIFKELEALAVSLNELEQTEICASVGGWKFQLKKIADVKPELN